MPTGGYSSQPISGFTGHIPGAKWQVGSKSKYYPQQEQSKISQSVSMGEGLNRFQSSDPNQMQLRLDPSSLDISQRLQHANLIDEGTQSEAGSFHDDYRMTRTDFDMTQHSLPRPNFQSPGSSNFSVGYDSQGMPMRMPQKSVEFQPNPQFYQPTGQMYYQQQQGFGPQTGFQQAPMTQEQYNQVQQHMGQNQISQQTGRTVENTGREQMRSKSLPRNSNIEKDPFEGVEGGWWSKGEIARNKERRELVNRGRQIAGGQWDVKIENSPERPRRQWQERQHEENDIPAAGYSGHIQGLRHLGIGKSFNTAAKQAKKEYIERRRATSGSRDNFYNSAGSSQTDAASEHLNFSHQAASGMMRGNN